MPGATRSWKRPTERSVNSHDKLPYTADSRLNPCSSSSTKPSLESPGRGTVPLLDPLSLVLDMPTPNMKTYRSNSMAMESTSWHLRGNSTGLSLLLHMTGNLHRMKQKGQMSLGSESQGQTSNPRLFGWKCGCLGRDGLVQNLKNLNLEPKSSSSAKC
ncbi:uncharacterized protein LOC144286196 isoform X1 [Canis aureus]